MTTIAVAAPGRASAPVSDGGHVRLTARGRRVLVVAALVLAAGVGAVGGRAVASTEVEPPSYETVTVTTGDTLWAIAERVATPDQDVRDVVASLVRINELDSVDLIAGQSILVPEQD
ncbi:Peptidoglycan-binding LysM [Beutenbergia cavernae DSM 12333]|uniref:Peptidoglycan-binding LysM n=1 Tax=Beutenbergia cavernae (strain ATCC BAA-8 / DSM 12333 / CCUG 43141 / JCM 11478 / NBRC 16432 / NCIMB 13614 / HKI 0122) TaxID=471853 RepID=C5BWL6_BEUC1|nr:LysM peptidoglycan-binding domain-containing protein [Beutenbergia cavernae]ACQ80682.1 Peptidoglycan-binding LysM [Beutenbergia cavernae DSM 12333]